MSDFVFDELRLPSAYALSSSAAIQPLGGEGLMLAITTPVAASVTVAGNRISLRYNEWEFCTESEMLSRQTLAMLQDLQIFSGGMLERFLLILTYTARKAQLRKRHNPVAVRIIDPDGFGLRDRKVSIVIECARKTTSLLEYFRQVSTDVTLLRLDNHGNHLDYREGEGAEVIMEVLGLLAMRNSEHVQTWNELVSRAEYQPE